MAILISSKRDLSKTWCQLCYNDQSITLTVDTTIDSVGDPTLWLFDVMNDLVGIRVMDDATVVSSGLSLDLRVSAS
jgi:hypothetical protein